VGRRGVELQGIFDRNFVSRLVPHVTLNARYRAVNFFPDDFGSPFVRIVSPRALVVWQEPLPLRTTITNFLQKQLSSDVAAY
jgi:hypothetical protein